MLVPTRVQRTCGYSEGINKKVAMLTAYDKETAFALSKTSLDYILVGDSYVMVKKGYPSTRHATMDMMVGCVREVKKGAGSKHVIGDMPYGSYNNHESALKNARRFIATGADSVKLEGGSEVSHIVRYITRHGIKVMGHLGYTPQTASCRYYGENIQEIENLIRDARHLQDAGAYAVVLELCYAEAADIVTKILKVPTIGIGSGPFTNGQVLVIDDILKSTNLGQKFLRGTNFIKANEDRTKQYIIKRVAERFIDEVRGRRYPMPWQYKQLCAQRCNNVSMSDLLDLKKRFLAA